MNPWLKRLGYVLGTVLCLILVAAAGVYGFSEARYRKQYSVAPSTLAIPADTSSLARGAHLAHSIAGCVECHGENLAGKAVIDVPVLARVYSANLTRGKGSHALTDADLVRAIRHGVSPSGRALKIMPSSDYMNLSDADLASIIAYVKSVAAVDNAVPAPSVGPLGRALMLAGKLPMLEAERIDHGRLHLAAVTPAATAGYGAYLASVGCKGCHGPALAGGPIATGDPSWPPAANLTPAGKLKTWTEEDFRRVLRGGKRPDGSMPNPAMPVQLTKNLSDDEIRAIWLYLSSLPATPTPGLQTASR